MCTRKPPGGPLSRVRFAPVYRSVLLAGRFAVYDRDDLRSVRNATQRRCGGCGGGPSQPRTYLFRLPAIQLLVELGVEGDAHKGTTVKHRTLVRRDPTARNLRQVHLIHSELFDELRPAGFTIVPGQIGENVTTRGLELLALPTGTKLHLGSTAVVQVTGLRNPCRQLDQHQRGLTGALLGRDENGKIIRKAGIMGIVLSGGEIRPGDSISIELPPKPHTPLGRV
jgi:MOSC domain